MASMAKDGSGSADAGRAVDARAASDRAYVSSPGPAQKATVRVPADGTYLRAEISTGAIRANLALLRERIGPSGKLCGVVKADCYGLGLATLLPVIHGGVDWMVVATLAEALELRSLGYDGPLLMFFSPLLGWDARRPGDALAELIAAEVTLTVVDSNELAAIAEAAGRAGTTAQLHVKIDTGMGRSGAQPPQAIALVRQIRGTAGVELTGLYTHFATADEADLDFARRQMRIFDEVVARCGGREGLTLHAANSAATIQLPSAHLDMVRAGIAMYGYQPSDEVGEVIGRLPLRPALRLTGPLMQIKQVPAGSRCGYGLTHTFDRDSLVGLVPVGYADGYLRSLSGRATMRLRGRDVNVCGRVSMDQTIIDITDVGDARIGDDVEVFSPEPAAPHSLANLARLAGTIPYELLTRLGRRARRVLVD